MTSRHPSLKLLIVANTCWNLFNFRLPLMRYLREKGFEVIAVAPRDEYVLRIEEEGFRYIELSMDNKGTNLFNDLALMWKMFVLLRHEKANIVLSYTPKPNIYVSLVSGWLGVPNIPNISGLGSAFIRQDLVTWIMKLLYRFALRYPRTVFFQNNDDKTLFLNLGLVEKSTAAIVPGSGVNTSLFKSSFSQNKEKIVFLLVARILWDKGIAEFVEAARIIKGKYSNIEFHLLGSLTATNPQAVPKEQVDDWLAEGVVKYLGVTDNVAKTMSQADCIVLPSYREGLPRVLIEAGSLAKPVVATDVAGCRDVVEDGVTGFLCEVKNAAALAVKMEKIILLSSEERYRMGNLGRQKVIKEFDEKIVIGKYMSAINKLIKRSG